MCVFAEFGTSRMFLQPSAEAGTFLFELQPKKSSHEQRLHDKFVALWSNIYPVLS